MLVGSGVVVTGVGTGVEVLVLVGIGGGVVVEVGTGAGVVVEVLMGKAVEVLVEVLGAGAVVTSTKGEVTATNGGGAFDVVAVPPKIGADT